MGSRKQSKRIYVYWGIALFLLVSTAVLCWLVVVPVWQVRRAVVEFKDNWDLYSGVIWPPPRMIEELGGSERAASRLSLYLQVPNCLAPDKDAALDLLTRCGEPAMPALERLLEHDDASIRQAAAEALEKLRATATGLYSDREAEGFREALSEADFTRSKAEISEAIGLDTSRLPMGIGGGLGMVSVGTRELSPSYVLREVTGGTFEDGATIRIDRKRGR